MKAICRVAKVKGAGSISGKSEHNYRQGQVPNADPERQHLNHEYVLNYENLGKAIQARIEHAGIERVRQDAVKGMEFILAASPERFKRDETGQTVGDYREHPWVKANLDFMKQQYGPNLVAFTLHQDEKTPHIHAIVVPITPDNRLCAKELFTPKTLRQLQTDYAQAMKPFGLERGIEGSRAKHVEMKQIYGLQQQERQAIERDLKPLQTPVQPLQIEQPGVLDLLNLERWRKEQEVKINAEYNRRLAEVENAAQKAQKAAVANATVKEQGKVLQQRLDTSEGLKQANHEKAQKAGQQLSQTRGTLEKVAVLLDEKRLNPNWSQDVASQVRSRSLPQMEKAVTESLKGLTDSDQLIERLAKKGYEVEIGKEDRTYLKDPKTEVRLDLVNDKIGGKYIAELINSSIEQTLKQQREDDLKPRIRQSRGPSL
jgi:hypothetical protein